MRDLGIISNELVLKDLAAVSLKYDATAKVVQRGTDKIVAPRELVQVVCGFLRGNVYARLACCSLQACLARAKETLEAGRDIRSVGDWGIHDVGSMHCRPHHLCWFSFK